ncbi:MAG: hypothetical protein IJ464_05235 [Alistipes sp.]|nr:hypothetical protein [Alistipes sp.]
MRTIWCIMALLCIASVTSAQQPEGESVRIESDSAAMVVLDSYKHLLPPHEFDRGTWLIRTWHPARGAKFAPIPDVEHSLWLESEMMPRVRVKVPRFVDYNSITLRVGAVRSTLTITNGSAYNYMPWPNSPQGYRDARTLSFPVPR